MSTLIKPSHAAALWTAETGQAITADEMAEKLDPFGDEYDAAVDGRVRALAEKERKALASRNDDERGSLAFR